MNSSYQRSKRPRTQKLITGLITLCFLIGTVGAALALDAAVPEPDGNKRKGKYTYRKVYKACMERGEVDSPKPIVNPDAKTQAQWQQVFTDKAFDDFKCQEEWAALSDTALQDIHAYLHSGGVGFAHPGQM